MELSLITNDPATARAAEDAGIERIFIDLERLGKEARQRGRPLFQSTHQIDDVARVKDALRRARVMVRVDPPHPGTCRQVRRVIELGADFVMLPWFDRLREAADFVAFVGDRARAVPLVECAGALAVLPDLCRLPGVAEIHVGLNDLSMSLGRRHWFEVLTDPALDAACATLRDAGVAFGFAGISSLSRSDLPVDPELVLAEQVCQGASRGWLGRTFRETALGDLGREVEKLRKAIAFWESAGAEERAAMRARLGARIALARLVQ
jgi:hypothetical protein